MNHLKMDINKYKQNVVSITADGASVNTGKVNGLFVQMAADGRPWLLGIHCVLHRVELAVKDSILQQQMFQTVKDLMVLLYTIMKQSGTFCHHFHKTANEMDVQVYRFPKVHGPRFVNHQRKGLQVLLTNWIPLLIALKKSLENKLHKTIQAKLTGIKKKLEDVRILSAACVMKAILDIVAQLSLKFEENCIQPFDVKPAVQAATGQLQELFSSPESVIENGGRTDGTGRMLLLDSVLQSLLMKPGIIFYFDRIIHVFL